MKDSVRLDEVVQKLENNSNLLRIKKLIFCVCKNRWNQDIDILNNLNLRPFIQELYELSPTIVHLKYIIYRIVIRLNKLMEYAFVADLIIDEMEILYPPSPYKKVSSIDTENDTASLIKYAEKQQEMLVVLELEDDNVLPGIKATLEIIEANNHVQTRVSSFLPPAHEIIENYENWKLQIRSLDGNLKLEDPVTQVTNLDSEDPIEDSFDPVQMLRSSLDNWYNSVEFSRIRNKLMEELDEDAEIRLIIRTQNTQLLKLPWHLFFDFFLNRYRKAEVALTLPEYQRVLPQSLLKKNVKILSILGNSIGVNVKEDRKYLEALPDSEVLLLAEPSREKLNNRLWEQGWNILFFSSNNFSNKDNQEQDRIYINDTEHLNIWGLKYALTKAIVRGLKLAIFNVDNGLALARELASLQLPQMIIMREAVPTQVAQEFVKFFLKSFSQGKSLYAAVREARESLQHLEKVFPGATWLPVIFQNPAVASLTWEECKIPIKKQYEESIEQKEREPINSSFLLETKAAITRQPQQLPPRPPQTIFYENIDLVNTLTGFDSEIYSIAITPDGKRIVSSSGDISHEDDTIKLWGLSTGTLINTLTGHLHWVNSVAISPDGQTIVSGSLDSTIRIWNLFSGTLKRPSIEHYHGVNCVAISPDGQMIVSGSEDNSIKIWNLSTGALINSLDGHFRRVNSVAISPNGEMLVSGSDDNTIRIWNIPANTLSNTLNGHKQRVNSVAISPDGQMIVSSSDDNTIKIWNLSTGNLGNTLSGHEKSVQGVAISPDGHTIISSSLDKTIKIWNLFTGTLINTLTGHENSVFCVALSPDGQTISSGSYGEIKVWRVSPK